MSNSENSIEIKVSTSKSAISKKTRQKALNELQISENLKKQADELTVECNISKKVFKCQHAVKPKPHKSNDPDKIQATKSIRVECTYYINICWPKNDSNPRVTTFESQYKNHDLNITTAIFVPSYRSLPELVMNQIKFYSENSPEMGKNRQNEINDPDIDAFQLLEILENCQKEDPGMFIAKKINQGRLFYIFWMDSKQQDLYQQANNGIIPTAIISDADTGLDAALKTFLPFVKHVYCIFHIRQNMDRHLQHTWLNETFSCKSSYLMGTLDKIKESWGKAFICTYFTAGMTSTQRVEGINGIIKKYVNSKSSLVEFFRGIQEFFCDQTTKAEYRDWIESLPYTNILTTSASERIFPHIIEKLKKYLTTEIYFIQKAQLDIGLEYNIALILPEQYESFKEDFIYENDPNSDDYADFAQISLESIISQIDKTKIIEDSDNPNCQEQGFIDITGQHSCITQSSTILSIFREDLEDTTNDVNKKIEKRHLYSDLFGLGRKIAQIATEKRRYDVLNTFNQVLDELYDDINEETSESASKKILNPHVIKCRRRPSFKRQKSFVEIHKDKQDGNHSNKESRACSNCEQTNHNVHRCSAP
ncbi:24607_t:CDS:2, partial [Gigaspora rosea]